MSDDTIYVGCLITKEYYSNIDYKTWGLFRVKNKNPNMRALVNTYDNEVYGTKEELEKLRKDHISNLNKEHQDIVNEFRNKKGTYFFYDKESEKFYIHKKSNIDNLKFEADVKLEDLKPIDDCNVKKVVNLVDIKTFRKILNDKNINKQDLM